MDEQFLTLEAVTAKMRSEINRHNPFLGRVVEQQYILGDSIDPLC